MKKCFRPSPPRLSFSFFPLAIFFASLKALQEWHRTFSLHSCHLLKLTASFRSSSSSINMGQVARFDEGVQRIVETGEGEGAFLKGTGRS
jgi:hypothetical protein